MAGWIPGGVAVVHGQSGGLLIRWLPIGDPLDLGYHFVFISEEAEALGDVAEIGALGGAVDLPARRALDDRPTTTLRAHLPREAQLVVAQDRLPVLGPLPYPIAEAVGLEVGAIGEIPEGIVQWLDVMGITQSSLHSDRNDTSGSTRVARRAGMTHAGRATAANDSTTAPNTIGAGAGARKLRFSEEVFDRARCES